jgi:hypothetical protein
MEEERAALKSFGSGTRILNSSLKPPFNFVRERTRRGKTRFADGLLMFADGMVLAQTLGTLYRGTARNRVARRSVRCSSRVFAQLHVNPHHGSVNVDAVIPNAPVRLPVAL